MADSVEWSHPGLFRSVFPSTVYDWILDLSRSKARNLVRRAGKDAAKIDSVIDEVYDDVHGTPVGKDFPTWIELNVPPAPSASSSSPSAPAAATQSSARNFSTRASLTTGLVFSTRSTLPSLPSATHRPLSTASSPSSPVDVAIIGAGINGMSIAYQLQRRSPSTSIALFEQAPSLGYGSSGYSTGFLRALYSFDETMELALDGIEAYKNWGEYTGLSDPQASFTHTGALWMLGKSEAENVEMSKRLEQFGVGSEVMDAKQVEERWKVLDTRPMPEYDEEGNEVEFEGEGGGVR